jgi:hypothetical protein
MATLSSPGVSVTVIDESFYTPAAPGTVPLIIVATAENKQNGAGTGIAPGTLATNVGRTYLITSQKDLVDTFGDPVFKTDASNNPIHAGEQNEYGLQAAYSLLGVSNRAYVVRAGIDLASINALATAPAADPSNGTYWLDTNTTSFGIFEWNGTTKTPTNLNGQTFTKKNPLVITDTTKVVDYAGSDYAPKTSIGAIGDYAVVCLSDLTTDYAASDKVYYKNRAGQWVQVGSNDWTSSWPTVQGTVASPTITSGQTFTINGITVTANAATVAGLAERINLGPTASLLSQQGITAGVSAAGRLEIYSNGASGADSEDSTASNAVVIASGTMNVSTVLGITPGTFYAPRLAIQPHTSIPNFKTSNTAPRPTGSVWIKTTEPNSGAKISVKRYNSATDAFAAVPAPIYADGTAAIYGLDRTGGGSNLAVGSLFVKTNEQEDKGADETPRVADFKIFRRSAVGTTIIKSAKIAAQFTSGTNTFSIAESIVGSATLAPAITVTCSSATLNALTGSLSDADKVAGAINSAGFVNIVAEVDSLNRIVISHTKGGEFRLTDGTATPLSKVFAVTGTAATANLYASPTGDVTSDYVATLWEPLRFTAGGTAPTSLTADGTLWYNSIVDEVDIMIHNGTTWVGYKDPSNPLVVDLGAGIFPTDVNGPIVAATEPTTQSDGATALANGDLWIDTSDTENYPQVYKFNGVSLKWDLVDSSDQSTENGILFGDARYNTAGANSDEPGLIADLLESNYIDFDAPDPALYPQGMLLWNLRRSGFNVKRYARNYVDVTAINTRVNGAVGETQAGYYPNRWVSEAANQEDGSGTFGRKAQRKVVVQALQALVNSNQEIREEEQRVFNLIACPGYPELIGEMITLNYDRGLTAFVVGDTPARLTSDATSLSNWGNNAALALEDNDLGAASFDEYMAMFYPWGFTSDNFGNNVVVPPSHMMLRTIALSDNVSYPWFAPAGTRRGGITNASAVGYIDGEGEFTAVALNNGQRDTLYDVKVNPITFLTGVGLVNYGQKTRARNASALDRINVARLVIYLRRQLSVLAKPYIFEPNDKITRDEIKGAVESLMLELLGQRALYDYIVVCDESNNTPSRIDRNELYVDVAIEPVKAVEFIYIPLRLKNTGEIAGL